MYSYLKDRKAATYDFWYVKTNFPKKITGSNVNENYYHSQLMWCDSNSFTIDIAEKIVRGVVNDSDGLVLRKTPYVRTPESKIKTLLFKEVVEVLSRSDKKQKIGEYHTYWYEVKKEEEETGWVYGWFLDFFPIKNINEF